MDTILIVDDSPTIRRMVKASLGAMPATTFVEAASGLEAIEALAVTRVQLVILDLNMPDMHGLEVLQFIRRHDQYREIPVIVLTTKYDADTRKAAADHGASMYMTKPFDPSALRQNVSSLLESK
jgi:two-component system, chemotaxis family, chemotaxis protein CheY